MEDPRDVQLLIYLVWVAIPVTLFVLACMYRVMQLLTPTPDISARLRPRRLIRLANLLFITAVVALSFDYFLIQSGRLASPFSLKAQYYRLVAFPIVAVLFLSFAEILRFSRPGQKYESMKVEVRGSNPLFTIAALVIFFIFVGKCRVSHEGRERKLVTMPTFHLKDEKSEGKGDAKQEMSGTDQAPLVLLGRWIDQTISLVPWPSSPPEESAEHDYPSPPDFNQENYLKYKAMMVSVAGEHHVEPLLLLSIAQVSSGFQTTIGSEGGPGGLLMLTPEILRQYGFRNNFNPEQSAHAGASLLRELLSYYGNDLHRALYAFHMGRESLSRQDALPKQGEGVDFVERVLSVYELARARGSLE